MNRPSAAGPPSLPETASPDRMRGAPGEGPGGALTRRHPHDRHADGEPIDDRRDIRARPAPEPAAGEHGTRRTGLFDYDAELRPHNELFRAAARVGSRDRVLDTARTPPPPSTT